MPELAVARSVDTWNILGTRVMNCGGSHLNSSKLTFPKKSSVRVHLSGASSWETLWAFPHVTGCLHYAGVGSCQLVMLYRGAEGAGSRRGQGTSLVCGFIGRRGRGTQTPSRLASLAASAEKQWKATNKNRVEDRRRSATLPSVCPGEFSL